MIFGKLVNKYYKKYWIYFLIGLIALVTIDYLQLEIPKLTSDIIDRMDKNTLVRSDLVSILMQVGIYSIVIVIGRFIWRFFVFGASRMIGYDIRKEMFYHNIQLSQSYYSEHKVGGLMAHYTNDLEAVRRAIGPGFIMTVDAVFLGIFVLYRMFELQWQLTLISAAPLIIIAALGGIIGGFMRKRFKARQRAFENLSSFTQENFSGISVIKAFVKESIERKEFLRINKDNKDKNIAFVKASAILEISVRNIVGLIYVMIIGFGGKMVFDTANLAPELRFEVADLVLFIAYFSTLVWPMMAIAMIINMRSQGNASMQRINQILEANVDIKDEDTIEVDTLDGDIEFRNLSFNYSDSETNVLEDISFKVKKGQTVGIL